MKILMENFNFAEKKYKWTKTWEILRTYWVIYAGFFVADVGANFPGPMYNGAKEFVRLAKPQNLG